MDLNIGVLWCLAFSAIILFLGALSYFLGRTNSDIKLTGKNPPTDTTNQQQSNRSSKRRKNTRKRRQQQATTAVTTTTAVNESSNIDNDNNDEQDETQITPSTIKSGEIDDERSSIQPTDDDEDEEEEEFEDAITIESSSSTPIPQEEKPFLPVKQRNKNKSIHNSSKTTSSTKNETNFPTKPRASVAPVKQSLTTNSPTNNNESNRNLNDRDPKFNGKLSSSSNTYRYSEHNSLPPRFQQRQQNEFSDLQKYHKTKSIKKSSISPSSAARQNEFVPSSTKQQIHNNQPLNPNGYSSESDILTESSSTVPPLSIESHFSNKNSDFKRSLSPSNILDELVSVFDKSSFSNDEIQLVLNKIVTKHLSNKQERQRLSTQTTTTKTDKTIERILDETYRSQAKILAIELQTEKNRVLELSKTNTDLDNTIQQLQQPNNTMLPYQQTILSYQMQIRKLTDDNTHLAHQLHTYSIMPTSINELKQQLNVFNEQLRQFTTKNSHLEKELADGERARVHAAEIYKKADTQKQERIEELMSDINKYKKIEKDLNNLQTKYKETEKSLNSKLNDLISQRDNVQKSCEELKEKAQEYEQLKRQYEQLRENQPEITNLDELQQQLDEAKAKNDLLKQRNSKIMEQLNKLRDNKQSEQFS